MAQQNSPHGYSSTARVRNIADSAPQNTQELAEKFAGQAREYGELAQDAASKVKPFLEKSLKEQPMATLAGAAVVAFLLGALWRK